MSSEALQQIIEHRAHAIRPDPMLTVSEWADKHRVLTTNESGIPGQWSTDRTPYLREPMDRLGVQDRVTRELALKFASQVGKTEVTNNALGYWIDCAPGPVMFVQPNLEMLKEWSRNRLDKMIEGSPNLRARVTEKKSRDSANTLTQKEFPGGNVVCRTAGSAAGLQSAPRRYVEGDETDKWGVDVDGAGSPIMNIRQRTASFSNSKIAWTSTPGIRGVSMIDKLYKEGDQRQYWVPCPRCGVYELLEWSDFVWTAIGRPAIEAAWQCPTCHELSESHEIHEMNARGVWVPSADCAYSVSDTGTIDTDFKVKSYYLPGWYSPWPKSSWGAIADEFVRAKGSPEDLTAWTNLREGISYDHDAGEKPDAESLLKFVEPIGGVVPAQAIVLTAATDIQGDRWETKIKAWGPGEESWIIDYVTHYGNPDDEAFWDKLDKAFAVKYPTQAGRVMPISCALVDAGYKTDRVYAFCAGKGKRRIWPIMGLSSMNTAAPIWPRRPVRAGKGKIVDRFDLNVGEAKSTVYARLAITARAGPGATGAGIMHFDGTGADDDMCDGEYFAQLTAEVRVQRVRAGKRWFEFIKTRPRNEALDLEGYNLAALRALQSMRLQLGAHSHASVDESDQRDQLTQPPKAQPVVRKRAPRTQRQGWGRTKW